MIRRATVLLTAIVAAIVVASGMGLSQTVPDSPRYAVKDLGILPGGSLNPDYGSIAYGINDSGEVVGVAPNSSSTHAFLYSDGQMQDLGTLPDGTESQSYDINNSGQIVGDSERVNWDGTRTSTAFLYKDGQTQNLNN